MMNKGFTLVEVIVSSALFIIAITIIAQTYLTITKSIILAQNLQANLDNVRYGLEKIWNEVKNGRDFPTSTISATSLIFKDRRCRETKIYRENNLIIYEVDNATSSLFDENLVRVNGFNVFFDTTTNNSRDYLSFSKKIVSFDFDLILKSGDKEIPYQIRLSAAPILSPISQNDPCQ